MYKKMLATIGLITIAGPIANIISMAQTNDQGLVLDKTEACFDLGELIYLDSNHVAKDDKNVTESEVAESIARITNMLVQNLASSIPGAELDKDYTIDTSQIHVGDLSRAAEVFVYAKQGSTLIKEGTFTSAWVIYVQNDNRYDLGTISFIDDNHVAKDDKNVTESEVAESIARITNRIELALEFHIPGAKLGRDYTIDTSQIHVGDLSRAAEVFINAAYGSNIIKQGVFTSVWVIYVQNDNRYDLGTLRFLDVNHLVKDDKNVTESEAAESIAKITNTIELDLDSRIPGAKLGRDYTIDTSQIHAGDLSRAAEVFINAAYGSNLIKLGTVTSIWIIYVTV